MVDKHVVVIEDDEFLRAILHTLLETHGYKVTALPYVSTIEELVKLRPDYFVIDEMLPVVNGHILCIILKSKPETKKIPVILISSSEKIEGLASLCEAEHFLLKPFNHESLLRLVRQGNIPGNNIN